MGGRGERPWLGGLRMGGRGEALPGWARSSRSTASSAVTVLPEPVGEPTRMFWSVWKTLWNTCTCENPIQRVCALSATGLGGGIVEDARCGKRGLWTDLRLDRVEMTKLEDALPRRLAERRLGQRAQVEELCVGGLRAGQVQLGERQRDDRLDAEPAVGDGAHEVARRQRLEERDREREDVRLVLLEFRQHEELLMVNVLILRILDPHPKGLGAAVVALGPLKRRRQREAHPQYRARDRLGGHVDEEQRQLAGLLFDLLRLPLVVDEGADLADLHLAQRVDRRALGLELVVDFVRQAAELAHRVAEGPRALLEHLGDTQHLLSVREPAARERDLEESSRDARRRLRDESAVGDEREGLDGQAADVGLHEDARLAGQKGSDGIRRG